MHLTAPDTGAEYMNDSSVKKEGRERRREERNDARREGRLLFNTSH